MRVIGGIADGQWIDVEDETIRVPNREGEYRPGRKPYTKYRRLKHAIGSTSFEVWVPAEITDQAAALMLFNRMSKVWGFYLVGDNNDDGQRAA